MIILSIMFILLFLITTLLMTLNFFISKKKMNDREKSSPFECGFDPLNSPRLPFSIQFYMISIIFLIFDVEIIIFFPLIPSFSQIYFFSWLNLSIYFIMILLFGLYIEWNDGALHWIK